MSKEITRQAEHQRKYPLIPVPAHIKTAVKRWAKENGVLLYKVGDLIETLPEIKKYIKEAKRA